MDLDCAGLPQHPDQGALGVATHNRIINHDKPFAANDFFERVQLEPDAKLTDGLRGLDERTPDVGILHQTLPEGDARFLGIAHGGGCARLRHPDHQVGLDRLLAGQSAADVDAGAVHRTPGKVAVGPGEVDVFEHAGLGRRGREAGGAHAVGVDGQQLPRFDIADKRCTDDVQCRRFGGDHPAAVQTAE